MTTVVVALSICCAFFLGGMIGASGTSALRLKVYQRVDDLISLIEEVIRHSHDGRMDMQVVLSRLYQLRQDVRLTDKQKRYERPDPPLN